MERKYIYCQNCGKKNDVGNENCKKCGYRLSRISQPPQLVQTRLRTGGKSGQKTLFIVLGCTGGALLLAALVFAIVKTDMLGRLFDRRAETTVPVTSISATDATLPDGPTTAASTTAPVTAAPNTSEYNYVVNTQSSALNIRSGPGLTFADIGNIPKGVKLTVPAVFDGWGYVVYQGKAGFVSIQYLKRLGAPPSQPLGMPGVKQSFALKQLYTFGDGVSVGFDVKLPQLNSAKPGASQFNLLLAKYRTDAETKRAQAGDLKNYDEYYFRRYASTASGSVLFVLVYSFDGYAYSEAESIIDVFAYDFAADKQLSDAEIAARFGKTQPQILAAAKKSLKGAGAGAAARSIKAFSALELFVSDEGRLFADCDYEEEISGYSAFIITPVS
ncbi:MAG TPA: hypothetical protein PL044_04320 [Clostridiales bacterium]|nr:MAG: Bacterial SH3 domain protein [Firmicutes bacterium ADurb.Bin262]HOU09922.1 hypothetical protein [Clostridiales bacterium]HQH63196.1 hypothetical protein [Clostridiales bacterium]HQK72987.1 hypothetical protein [Clostridiales bacterium]